MRDKNALKPDAAVAGIPDPTIWVLAQVSPKFEVLAASPDRNRLVFEMTDLCEAGTDFRAEGAMRFIIRATNTLFA